MSWRDLLTTTGETKTLPWCGGGQVSDGSQTWHIVGKRPLEHDWYQFRVKGGREVSLVSREPVPMDMTFSTKTPKSRIVKGYLIGDRLIPDASRVDPDPDKLVSQTLPVFCVERGLERFTRATTVRLQDDSGLIFISTEFPEGPEQAVLDAYQDRKSSVQDIPGVTPALDLAFRWVSYQRVQAEIREQERERLRLEEEARLLRMVAEEAEKTRLQELMKDASTAMGRRALASRDFNTAAREALRVSGAVLLDTRESNRRGEMVVQYRFMERRLECVVDRDTLRILEAGVCLTGSDGVRGDTRFTLESLPGVIAEAIQRNVLVVFRGDRSHYENDWDRDDD